MMFMRGTKKERPLTHDLLANILRALGAKIERVIVNDLKRTTYFATLARCGMGNGGTRTGNDRWVANEADSDSGLGGKASRST